MSIANGYCTLQEFTNYATNAGTFSTSEQVIAEFAVESASRQIDQACNRRFYLDSATTSRTYVSEAYDFCSIDDLGSVAGLVVATDTGGDGVFETTWASTDYQTEPANAIARDQAITGLRAVGTNWFPCSEGEYLTRGTNRIYFPGSGLSRRPGERLIQVTSAYWGWPSVPMPIKMACLTQAAHLYAAKGAPFGVAGSQDLGEMRLLATLHPVANALVKPYRRDSLIAV